MEYVDQFLHNRILIAGVLGWFFAQILKTVIYAVVNKKLDWNRLIGDGGMPSSHSATVTSVALAAGIEQGFGSPVFAVAFIVAMVVMHDASGVRQETGRMLRKIFTASEKDNILIGADYSQVELRIMAHLSEDPSLTASFTRTA